MVHTKKVFLCYCGAIRMTSEVLRVWCYALLCLCFLLCVIADAEIEEMSKTSLFGKVKSIFPSFKESGRHKGQAGRIGFIGGSLEYTGAPYYASMSALKAGADLAYVFCTSQAAIPIKSYSPELIVYPLLISEETKNQTEFDGKVDQAVDSITPFLSRLHALVIGPGLGRNEMVLATVKKLIVNAKKVNMPIVLDGDALFLLAQSPELVQNYENCILTPNVIEFDRLYKSVFNESGPSEPKRPDWDHKIIEAFHAQTIYTCIIDHSVKHQFYNLEEEKEKHPLYKIHRLSNQLGKVTIVQKGEIDIISNGDFSLFNGASGSPRRCGGQGDVLAGTMGLFLSYALTTDAYCLRDLPTTLMAAYTSSFLTRYSAELAFNTHKRSTTTPNIIESIGAASEFLFPVQYSRKNELNLELRNKGKY